MITHTFHIVESRTWIVTRWCCMFFVLTRFSDALNVTSAHINRQNFNQSLNQVNQTIHFDQVSENSWESVLIALNVQQLHNKHFPHTNLVYSHETTLFRRCITRLIENNVETVFSLCFLTFSRNHPLPHSWIPFHFYFISNYHIYVRVDICSVKSHEIT